MVSSARSDEGPVDEPTARPGGWQGIVGRVDRYQRDRPWLAFPIAVWKKFGDDGAASLAGLIAYYGFFSLFPLMLVLVTVLGIALRGDPHLQQRVLHSMLAQIPVIGSQLQRNMRGLSGGGIGLVVGLAGAVWGGLGVANYCQEAMNTAWAVPRRDRPGFVPRVLRSAALLALIAVGLTVTTGLTATATSSARHSAWVVLPLAGAVALNVVVFTAAFRVSTTVKVRVTSLVPGAVAAGVAWAILQVGGAYYVNHQLRSATDVYGLFAVVLGLLSWLYLQAQVTMLCAEVNVVRARRLWPRTLAGDHLGPADRRALALEARIVERRPGQVVDVRFESSDIVPTQDR